MKIVIAGAGRGGLNLAVHLQKSGHSVVVLERDASVAQHASEVYGIVALTGDATDASVLRQADPSRADALLAMLHRDADNLGVGLLGRALGAKRIIVRMRDPSYRSVYEAVGIRQILSETEILVGALATAIEFEAVRPVLALPAWRVNRTQPVDGRDVLEFLAASATLDPRHTGRAWDIGGPEVMSYQQLIEGIAKVMLLDRPAISLPFNLTPVASVVAAVIAEEDAGLIEPLMESLEHDLLPRDGDAAAVFGVRLHHFQAAVERALRDMESATHE